MSTALSTSRSQPQLPGPCSLLPSLELMLFVQNFSSDSSNTHTHTHTHTHHMHTQVLELIENRKHPGLFFSGSFCSHQWAQSNMPSSKPHLSQCGGRGPSGLFIESTSLPWACGSCGGNSQPSPDVYQRGFPRIPALPQVSAQARSCCCYKPASAPLLGWSAELCNS